MAGKEHDYRIFIGGLSRDITERKLEDTFSRFGKILDSQLMLERDTGRPRGFGFLTFADRRAMEDAIRDMHGREFGERVISVNKAQPKIGDENPGYGYGGYPSGGRGSYGGGDRSVGQNECFKCGRPGHWARDCPLAGGGRGGRPFSPPRPKYGGRYLDDKYDRGHYGDRDRYDSKYDRYGSRDRYVNDRYPPPTADRFVVDKYRASDHYPVNGNGRERSYVGPRGTGDRYGGGGPARYEGRNYRERPGPYDHPRREGRSPSFDRY